jgi:hypothetical protein
MPDQQDPVQAQHGDYSGNSKDRRRAKRLEDRIAENVAVRIFGQLGSTSPPTPAPDRAGAADGEHGWAAPGLELGIGVLLHAVGLEDVLPFWLSVGLYLVSCTLLCHSVWSLTRNRTWRWFIRAGVLCAWAVLAGYGTYRQYEREVVAIQFKDNPALTSFREQIIRHDFSRARIFLEDLGLPTPTEIPPVAVNEKQSAVSPAHPVYRGELQIQPGKLANRPVVTNEYMSYVMSVYLEPLSNLTGVNFILSGMYQLSAWGALADYFNSAYWDQNLNSWPWSKRLWTVRGTIGKAKTDRIVAYTTKLIKDTPGADFYVDKSGDINKGFDAYFSRKLKIAYTVVDSQAEGWGKIASILEKDGVSLTDVN